MSELKTIGILIAGHMVKELSERFEDYGRMFIDFLGEGEFRYKIFFVVDDIFPNGPEDADGWLISGSSHAVYDGYRWIERLEDFVRAIRASNRPLVGICFGHQLVAKALGGCVEKFNGGWSVGAKVYKGLEDKSDLTLLSWHQDQVVKAPDTARILAGNDFCVHAVLAYDDWALTFQAHPEFEPPYFTALVEARREVVGEVHFTKALSDLENTSNKVVAELIRGHFRQAWDRQLNFVVL